MSKLETSFNVSMCDKKQKQTNDEIMQTDPKTTNSRLTVLVFVNTRPNKLAPVSCHLLARLKVIWQLANDSNISRTLKAMQLNMQISKCTRHINTQW